MTAEIRYPRKVLLLVQGLGVGGLEFMVIELANRLDRKKFIPSICCFDKLGKLQDRLLDDTEVILLKRKPGKDLLYPFKLAAFLKKENIDVIHLHNQTAFFYCLYRACTGRCSKFQGQDNG